MFPSLETAFTSAPKSKRTMQVSIWPSLAARISAVKPYYGLKIRIKIRVGWNAAIAGRETFAIKGMACPTYISHLPGAKCKCALLQSWHVVESSGI